MIQNLLPRLEVDVFRSNHRPYYIVTPEWVQHSMGARVTFHLCHILNELGYEAYVVAQNQAPNLRTPLLTKEIIERHKSENRPSIAIYTELMWGNTLNADVVVRYITNRIGMYGNDIIDKEALYYYWCEGYSTDQNPNLLCFPTIDHKIFNDIGVNNSKRKGFAYYAHKYLAEGNGVIADRIKRNGISLCKDIPRTHKEIADILRSVKVLYLYEDSAVGGEAALCGCPVVLVKTDFFLGMESIFNCFDAVIPENEINVESDYKSKKNPADGYKELFANSSEYIRKFIQDTQGASLGYRGRDDLLSYCEKYKRVCIYGGGIFASMVYSALSIMGINIECFIVSDCMLENNDETYLSLPVRPMSWLKSQHSPECGLVVAMVKGNAEQVVPSLNALGLRYFY